MTEEEALQLFKLLEEAEVDFIIEAKNGMPIHLPANEVIKLIDLDELLNEDEKPRRRRRRRVDPNEAIPMDDCGVPANLQVAAQRFLSASNMKLYKKDRKEMQRLKKDYMKAGVSEEEAKRMAMDRLIDIRIMEGFNFKGKEIVEAIKKRMQASGSSEDDMLQEVERIRQIFKEMIREREERGEHE